MVGLRCLQLILRRRFKINKEHSQKLITDFPNMFELPYGFECGDGWFQLIYDLSKALYEGCIDHGISIGSDQETEDRFYVNQVKEKYGTLRYYTNYRWDWMDLLIDKAEGKSESICEACGKEGFLDKKQNWYYTRCNNCWKQV